jgi:hypothetical protein
MSIIGLLVSLVVICLVIWAVRALLAAFGIGNPIATVVHVILVILIVIWLLNAFGLVGGPLLRLR